MAISKDRAVIEELVKRFDTLQADFDEFELESMQKFDVIETKNLRIEKDNIINELLTEHADKFVAKWIRAHLSKILSIIASIVFFSGTVGMKVQHYFSSLDYAIPQITKLKQDVVTVQQDLAVFREYIQTSSSFSKDTQVFLLRELDFLRDKVNIIATKHYIEPETGISKE